MIVNPILPAIFYGAIPDYLNFAKKIHHVVRLA